MSSAAVVIVVGAAVVSGASSVTVNTSGIGVPSVALSAGATVCGFVLASLVGYHASGSTKGIGALVGRVVGVTVVVTVASCVDEDDEEESSGCSCRGSAGGDDTGACVLWGIRSSGVSSSINSVVDVVVVRLVVPVVKVV
jgi:hypothetical protein